MSETMCCPLSRADCDPPRVYNQRQLRAGKACECGECGEKIAKGTRYERVDGCWEGDWSVYKTCLSCVEIRDHFACGNGWTFGEVWEQIEENFFPDMKAGGQCMEGLSPEAKARLIAGRMEWYLEQDEIDDDGIALPPGMRLDDRGNLVREAPP